MDRDFAFLLIGAAIALVSSIITALVQHYLSLRAEKTKREWEKKERESQELRNRLTEGTQIQLTTIVRRIIEREDEIREIRLNVQRETNTEIRKRLIDGYIQGLRRELEEGTKESAEVEEQDNTSE